VNKRIIRFAARFYPTVWRERYGAELDALLEDMSLHWIDMWDLLGGALAAHIRTWSFRQLAFVLGLTGAIIATAIAFSMDNKYISTAVVSVASADGSTAVGGSVEQVLHLYSADQQHKPLEDVIQKMRQQGVQLVMLDSQAGESKRFEVKYVSRDSSLAQKTVAQTVSNLLEANLEVAANLRSSRGLTIEQLFAPSRPLPIIPNRLIITGIGIGAGVLLAAASALALRLVPGPASTGRG
jgi:hypothetical protein